MSKPRANRNSITAPLESAESTSPSVLVRLFPGVDGPLGGILTTGFVSFFYWERHVSRKCQLLSWILFFSYVFGKKYSALSGPWHSRPIKVVNSIWLILLEATCQCECDSNGERLLKKTLVNTIWEQNGMMNDVHPAVIFTVFLCVRKQHVVLMKLPRPLIFFAWARLTVVFRFFFFCDFKQQFPSVFVACKRKLAESIENQLETTCTGGRIRVEIRAVQLSCGVMVQCDWMKC